MSHKNIFQYVPNERLQHNRFDLSHDRKFSTRMGLLTPCLITDTNPNETFTIQSSHLIRFAALVAPVMHSVTAYVHYFFVPNRILWENWDEWISGGERGQSTAVKPYILMDFSTLDVGTVGDYLSFPAGTAESRNVKTDILPIAAFWKIWNEYYRSQDLQDPVDLTMTDGDNSSNPIWEGLFKVTDCYRSWEHDYFTSALPETQKGPEVTLPLGAEAPLVFNPDGSALQELTDLDGVSIPGSSFNVQSVPNGGATQNVLGNPSGAILADMSTTHYADLSAATASSIIELRRAVKLQEFLELNARGGTRPNEFYIKHFNIDPGDGRLHRPEYIGGTRASVVFSEVLQTSSNETEPTPLGTQAGHGVSVSGGPKYSYRTKDHGWIIGIMSVMPATAYVQGLPAMYSKFDRFDYFFSQFQGIGEAAIYNRELFISDDQEVDDGIFGYKPRFAEYKYIPSSVHGEFRTSLDFYHLARYFDDTPPLNEEFIICNPRTDIFAVEIAGTEQLYCQMYHSIEARRPMEYYGSPRW